MDETPMALTNLAFTFNCTKDYEGDGTTGVRFTIDETKRFATLVLTIRADAYCYSDNGYSPRDMVPLIIFRGNSGNKKEAKKYARNVSVRFNPKAWMDTHMAQEYFKLWKAHLPTYKLPCVLLVDNLSSHVSNDFVGKMKSEANTYVYALPKNTTHFSQPVDRHVAKTMKDYFIADMEAWYWKLNQKSVRSGKVQVVSISALRIQTTKSVQVAWKRLLAQENLIASSFSRIGLSLPLDGSCDYHIAFEGAKETFFYGLK